jgi:uroporphyrin-III C-methyltransferase / precorrin-2 dehydrogenase / sirohydrochlorin ferrochelatase
MRYLPVFLDLQAGPVLLIGAGELAAARLRVLASAGARVRWYGRAADDDVSGLEGAQAAQVELVKGDPLAADLTGVLAVFCAGAGEVGVAMAARAKSAGLPVNVTDDPVHSTFIFPAIVDRGDVVVAIGTGGASPVVARRVRERIEAALPARIGELAGFIGYFRKSIHSRIPELPLRRRFWERVVDGPIGALVLAGRKGEAETAIEEIDDPSAFAGALASGQAEGSVALVGAGPGDPDLLTVQALRMLQDADLVFHDEQASSDILDRIRRDASRVTIAPAVGPGAVVRLMIEAAKSGQRVVRLTSGDAAAFGRSRDEIETLRATGVTITIVPGVASAAGGSRPSSAVSRVARRAAKASTK